MNQFERALYFYRQQNPAILAAPRNEWAMDPYAWDGLIHMTPIEKLLWGDIRDANAVFYPQYPVERFFVDFANPVAKVAIECDGAAYHTDVEKDMRRDARLRELGWSVYRITGRECHTEFDDETREYGYARQFIDRIAQDHKLKRIGSSRGSDGYDCAVSVVNFLLEKNPA